MESEPLTLKDKFKFLCHKGLECFNECCKNQNLFLTPYDVIRMKNRLKITSTEFLKKYTTWHIGYYTGLPVVMLKMEPKCPFVSEEGCTIYEDRPSSCRLYPLARVKIGNEEYYYIVKEDFCKGFEEDKEWTVEEWIKDQGAEVYNRMNDVFMELISAKNRCKRELSEDEIKMVYTACFDIDRFREYLSENYDVLSYSDEELMVFAIKWVIKNILQK